MIQAHRPDLTLIDETKNKESLTDVAVPWDSGIEVREREREGERERERERVRVSRRVLGEISHPIRINIIIH